MAIARNSLLWAALLSQTSLLFNGAGRIFSYFPRVERAAKILQRVGNVGHFAAGIALKPAVHAIELFGPPHRAIVVRAERAVLHQFVFIGYAYLLSREDAWNILLKGALILSLTSALILGIQERPGRL